MKFPPHQKSHRVYWKTERGLHRPPTTVKRVKPSADEAWWWQHHDLEMMVVIIGFVSKYIDTQSNQRKNPGPKVYGHVSWTRFTSFHKGHCWYDDGSCMEKLARGITRVCLALSLPLVPWASAVTSGWPGHSQTSTLVL